MNQADKQKYDETLAYIEEFYEQRDPTPADPIARILLPYFEHRYDYIHAKPKTRKGKLRWKTEKKHLLHKRNLWIDWNREDTIIGLGFSMLTRRVMIDVDINSPYHPHNDEEAYQRLIHTLEDLGLCCPIVIQSSWSQGLHIYYFFLEGVSSYYASRCIQNTLKAARFDLKNGHLEVFPNTKQFSDGKKNQWSAYKPHRLPLQPGTGSCILSTFSLEYKGTSLNKFAHMVEESCKHNDVEHFERMIEFCRHNNQKFWENHQKRGKVTEWRRHIVDFINEGWTDFHQTNVLLGKIAILCHVFDRKQGEELESAMKELAISLPGYYQYCRHQHEIERRCKDWARSVQIHYRMLYEYPERKENYTQMFNRTAGESFNQNERKSQETSSKIKRIYDHLLNTVGTLPQKIGDLVNLLIKTAKELTGVGISRNTLFKNQNLPLWHPEFLLIESEIPNPALVNNCDSPLPDSERQKNTPIAPENGTPSGSKGKVSPHQSSTTLTDDYDLELMEQHWEALAKNDRSRGKDGEKKADTSILKEKGTDNRNEIKMNTREEGKSNLEPVTAKKDKKTTEKPVIRKKQSAGCNQEKNKEVSTSFQTPSTDKSKKTTGSGVGQENRQAEARKQKASEVYPTPDEVVRKNEAKSETAESKRDKDSGVSSHTLPLMKCISAGDSGGGGNDEVVLGDRGMFVEGERLYEKVERWFYSGQKLRCLRRGYGMVEIPIKSGSRETKRQLRSFEPEEDLIISSIDHTSCWIAPDDEQNLMVYVIPIAQRSPSGAETENWLDGVAVRALDLFEGGNIGFVQPSATYKKIFGI